MARIPEEELARLKREVDLVALVRAAGVDLKPVGADLRGLCPFHEEKTPSFVVTPDRNLFRCFGCNAAGGPIDFVMRSQGLSFRHSVEVLRAGPGTVAPASSTKHSTVRRLPPPVALDADDQRLLNQVVGFYHEALKASPEALGYLKRRGLDSSEMVERFRLGYANRTLGYRLPDKNRVAGAEIRGRLTALGIFRDSGHEHFTGSVVFPILDEGGAGNVLGVYGRKITPNLREGTPLHLYLKGPHRGVWNVGALAASKECILTEGIIDALSFWCAGFRHVVAAYGVHGVTEDHFAAWKRYGTEKVYIAFDRDEAGDKAAEDLAPRLAEVGIDVARILFPRGMDANDYARKVAPASEGLGLALRAAQFVLKGRRVAATVPPATAGPSELAAPPVDTAPSRPSEDLGAAATEVVVDPPAAPAFEAAAPPSPAEPPAAEVLDASSVEAPSEPLPLAAAAAPGPALSVHGDEVEYVVGDRSYRVRGIWKNNSADQLRVSLRVARDERVYLDSLDLVSARAREHYVKQAGLELSVEADVVKHDLGKLLLELELLQQERIQKVMAPKPKHVQIPEEEKQEAFAFLKDPRLLSRIVEDFDRIGLVGERTNKLVGYLAAVSRKMEDPLAVLIQSNSAAGKSALMDAVLELCPEEDVERYTAMTGQSLYYMADVNLKHKILAIAEVAGAERAGYAIKTLQSDGNISIATTVKDPETGEMRTKRHEVEGPVAIMLTTTEAEIDEELQNRAVVLTVNEDREQTRAIHEAQRRAQTLPGLLARRKRRAIARLHRNAQRLLRPLLVVNPYAEGLSFLDTKLRTRRDHAKYLTLINAVTLLRQYQRPIHQTQEEGQPVSYIEVTPDDIAIANELADEVLGRSLDDLAPHTRRLLLLLYEMVTTRCAALKMARDDLRFTRREVREYTGWGVTQTRLHLDRLVDLEYLLVHRAARGQGLAYELLYDGRGQDGRPFCIGLLDPKAIRRTYDAKLAGGNGEMAARDRA